MDYQNFLDEVQDLEFISDEAQADAAVKAVLGILASRLDEPDAKRLTEKLPEPLTLEKLRGQQVHRLNIDVDEYYANVRGQLKLNEEDAEELVNLVFCLTKQALGNGALTDIQDKLPPDWQNLIQNTQCSYA